MAICHGWIDGQRRGLDDALLPAALHAPQTAEQVVADQPSQGHRADRDGRMRPAGPGSGRGGAGRRALGGGLRAPEPARTVPADFQEALWTQNPAAAEFFATLTGSQPLRVPVPAAPRQRRPPERAERIADYIVAAQRAPDAATDAPRPPAGVNNPNAADVSRMRHSLARWHPGLWRVCAAPGASGARRSRRRADPRAGRWRRAARRRRRRH